MDYPEIKALLYQLHISREWVSTHRRTDLYGRHTRAWTVFYGKPGFERQPEILRDGWQDDWVRASRHIFLQTIARHENVRIISPTLELRSAKQIPDEPLEIITRWLEGHQVIRAVDSETTLEQMSKNLSARSTDVLYWMERVEEEIWDRAGEYCLEKDQAYYRRFPRGTLPVSRTRWSIERFMERA